MGLDIELIQLDLPIAEQVLRDPRLLPYFYFDREWLSHRLDEEQNRDAREPSDIIQPAPEWAFDHLMEGEKLQFDRAWFQLEQILSGQDAGGPPPFGNIAWGGREIEAHGLESCYFLSAFEVKQLSDALQALTAADIDAAFDRQWPPGGAEFPTDELRADRRKDMYDALEGLRPFYVSAAQQHRAVFKHIW